MTTITTLPSPHSLQPLFPASITSCVPIRFTQSWQQNFLLASTILAVASAVTCFFNGSMLLGFVFVGLGTATALGGHYMKQFHLLQGLEQTAADLAITNGKLQKVAKKLEKENDRLERTSSDLKVTNGKLKKTGQRFEKRTASSLMKTKNL